MSDQDRWTGEIDSISHRHGLTGPALDGVVVAVVAVTVSGEIQSGGAVIGREHGGHMRPPVAVRPSSVDEQQPGTPRLSPGSVRDASAVDMHLSRIERHGERLAKPSRSVRVNGLVHPVEPSGGCVDVPTSPEVPPHLHRRSTPVQLWAPISASRAV